MSIQYDISKVRYNTIYRNFNILRYIETFDRIPNNTTSCSTVRTFQYVPAFYSTVRVVSCCFVFFFAFESSIISIYWKESIRNDIQHTTSTAVVLSNSRVLPAFFVSFLCWLRTLFLWCSCVFGLFAILLIVCAAVIYPARRVCYGDGDACCDWGAACTVFWQKTDWLVVYIIPGSPQVKNCPVSFPLQQCLYSAAGGVVLHPGRVWLSTRIRWPCLYSAVW